MKFGRVNLEFASVFHEMTPIANLPPFAHLTDLWKLDSPKLKRSKQRPSCSLAASSCPGTEATASTLWFYVFC